MMVSQRIEVDTITPGFGVSNGLAQAGLGRIRARAGMKEQIKFLLSKTAETTHGRMYELAPSGEDRDRGDTRKLRDSITWEGSVYSPGGRGGGGFHQSFVGIKLEDEVDHQRYVVEDTRDIYDTPMLIPDQRGGNIFTSERKGYPAITDWYRIPFAQARIDIQNGVRNFRDPGGSNTSYFPG